MTTWNGTRIYRYLVDGVLCPNLQEPVSIQAVRDGEEYEREGLFATKDVYLETIPNRLLIKGVVGILGKRERYVITRRFWYDDTLEEVGEKLGKSRERVRQIEEEAIFKMRTELGLTTESKASLHPRGNRTSSSLPPRRVAGGSARR